MCDRRALKYGYTYNNAKKYNYTSKIISSRKYIPQSQSPFNVSICIYIPHSRSQTFPFAGTSHTIFPVKSFVITLPSHTILTILSFVLLNASHTVHRRSMWKRMSITHTFYVVNVCARWPKANSFEENVMCDCSLIQCGLFLEIVCVA